MRLSIVFKKFLVIAVCGIFVFAVHLTGVSIPATSSTVTLGCGILLAAVLGRGAAFVLMCIVVLSQTLFFSEGGVLTLIDKILITGVVPCFLMYPYVFKPIVKSFSGRRVIIASVLSVFASDAAALLLITLEVFIFGGTELSFKTLLFLFIPLYIAITTIEIIITTVLLSFVYKVCPAFPLAAATGKEIKADVSVKKVLFVFVCAAVFMTVVFFVFKLFFPEGLRLTISGMAEYAGQGSGGAGIYGGGNPGSGGAVEEVYEAEEGLSPTAAGLLGLLVTFILGALLGLVMSYTKKKKHT